ncbi:MAG: class II aldolase/adducin family protein [Gemmatimonadaceae bacterium]
MAEEERAARHGIVRVCRRLYERGLIAGPDGNVSVRIGEGRILVTPAGMSKVDVRAADIVEITPLGEQLSRGRPASSEVAVHLRIYERRPDLRSVVHAHPPTATGFAVAGEDLMAPVLPEIILQVGGVPIVPYDAPGTRELAERFDPWLADHDAFLMANHGAVTAGRTLEAAHQRMESVEHAARILFTARLLGNVNELTRVQAAALHAARVRGAGVAPPTDTQPPAGRRSL